MDTYVPEGPNPVVASCSGVVIAPNLVLTSRECTNRPADDAAGCDRTNRWAPVSEDGQPNTLGPTLNVAENMAVTLGGDPSAIPTVFVTDVITPDATSFCTDDFAVLVLDSPVDVEPVPVRLDATTRLGDELLLSGFGGDLFPTPRRELPGVVSQIVSERGDVRAPPLSLFLRASACTYDRGGAALSPETGALVGTIVNDPASDCDDSHGTTLAVNLAAHRGWLLDAAARAGASLRSELHPDVPSDQQPRACDPGVPYSRTWDDAGTQDPPAAPER